MQAWADDMDPPLGVAGMLQRKGNPIYLVPVPLQKLLEECQFDHRSACGASHRFFLSGLNPLAFVSPKVTRPWYYLTHSWRSVHEHQGIFHTPVVSILHIWGQTFSESLYFSLWLLDARCGVDIY